MFFVFAAGCYRGFAGVHQNVWYLNPGAQRLALQIEAPVVRVLRLDPPTTVRPVSAR
jgi:hypothetical protein